MVGFTGEVLDTLDRSIVLASGFTELDTDPFAGRERGSAVETDESLAHGNLDDAPYYWLGHRRRPAVAERSKLLSITDQKWTSRGSRAL